MFQALFPVLGLYHGEQKDSGRVQLTLLCDDRQ